jgi:hypothetical protein
VALVAFVMVNHLVGTTVHPTPGQKASSPIPEHYGGDSDGLPDTSDRGGAEDQFATGNSSGRRGPLAASLLLVLHAIVSVVLAASAFVDQLALGACSFIGSAARCDYALGSASFYAFLAAVIVVFATVIVWTASAQARDKRSWPIPLLGSTSLLAAYLVYGVLVTVSTR